MKPKKKAAHPRAHKDEITAGYADRHGHISAGGQLWQ